MARFLSIGECMVEMSPQADGRYDLNFAGDTFNTAWYARRIAGSGTRVAYLSAIGDDEVSAQMRTFMDDAGIECELALRPGKSVGLYMITLKDGERSFSYWRDTSAAKTLADDLNELPDMQPGDMAFFSGITLAILDGTGRENLLKVLSEARSRGVRVAFDPNLRPRLWTTDDEMCHWIMKGAEVADIALPSFEDEGTYFGDSDTKETAARYAAVGVMLNVVKDGPRAVLIAQNSETIEVSPPKAAAIVDTTAAGDSFNAGFLMAHLEGLSNDQAAHRACALAAKVIANRGALVEV